MTATTDSAPSSPQNRPSAWAPLRHRVFFWLFLAQIASNVGSMMQSVGAAWLMGDLTTSPTLVALVQTATLLPVFLLGLPAGALADIFDRRRLLIVSQSWMLLTALWLAVLSFADLIAPWSLLFLTFSLGVGAALTLPAWQAIQPELVPRAEFPQAVALGALTFNLGRAIGPAVGGVIVATAGPPWVFLLNAVSFLVVVAVLMRWRRRVAVSTLPAETMAGAMRAGLRYGANSRALRHVLIRSLTFVLPAGALLSLLPVVARDRLGLGSGGYGLLLACFGVGAALAAVLRPRIDAVLNPDRMVELGTIVIAVVLLIDGLATNQWVVGAGLFFGGGAWTLTFTTTNVAAQSALPAWVRARGMGLFSLVTVGGLALGSALWGLVASRSLVGAQVLAAVTLLVGGLATRRWRVSAFQHLDLSPAPSDDPIITLVPRPTDGPVLVSVTYQVPEADMAEFTSTMRRVERQRRRTGARRWGLYRDLAAPDLVLEVFVVESWAEHLRQHDRRTTTDLVALDIVRPFVRGDVAVAHYVSAYSLADSDQP
ncbi:MAG TPA: MFS transporter [Acidimicrobiales bacterium]|nr:MFS transporter [Acidimicrobiales bacterium]